MNYTLTINLEGADDAEKSIDSLLKKVGGISSTPKISFSDWLDYGDAPEKAGEDIGDKVAKGAKKKLMSFNILDAWGKAMFKGIKDGDKASSWWDAAVKNGTPSVGTIKGLRETGGRDLAKVNALPDINSFAQSADFKKVLLGIGTGFLNPWIGSRLLSDELAKNQKTGENGMALGIFGKGGAGGFTEFYLLFKAAKIAIDLFIGALKMGAQWIKRAIENAHELYGRALSLGLSTRLVAQRSMTANVLGVPEDQVMRFKQSTYVMQRLGDAINSISKDAPMLAQVSAEWKILDYDILALASDAANKLGPSLIGCAVAIDTLVKSLEGLGELAFVLAKMGKLGNIGEIVSGGLSLFNEIFSGIGNRAIAASGFNQPLSMMKQLPASSWERMGLITMGGSSNYPQQTAKNTRDTVIAISKLAKYMSNPKGGKPTWGMDRNTAQP